jgi:cytosine/adenosine deaminase-related metal-dependent hydrolase
MTGYVVDLHDHVIFPGLINAHDHLFGTWWPRVAPGRPYTNVYHWLDEYEHSAVLYDRGQNSAKDMYEFGAYRNLISGVTTIADHYKRIEEPEFYNRYPVHVLYKYGRTWLPRLPRRTGWGDDIPVEYNLAMRTGQPYIIHLAEGVDAETAQEMDILTQANALGRNTVIIHGIALRPEDMRLMAEAGASVCWCPGSNLYLYGVTANISALQKARVNITLGTDSSVTGGLNILDEVRIARRAFGDQTGEEPPSRWLVELRPRSIHGVDRG